MVLACMCVCVRVCVLWGGAAADEALVCMPCAAGVIDGDVRVSGHPKVQTTFARVMGYCEQVNC